MQPDNGWTDLLAFDREHLWHPYTSMIDPLPVYPVQAAEGVRIQLADGRWLVDGMASWWAVIHGYGQPELKRAAVEQMDRMSHVMFGGITHEPAIDLGRKLSALLPPQLNRIFYCDSGSVAVEVAIKMAIQYWRARGVRQKSRLLTIRSGYHGDTFMAMSVCDPVAGMHGAFQGVLPLQLFAPAPKTPFGAEWDPQDTAALAELLAENHEEVAALILEPVVQGAGGMRFYHPQYLTEARRLCDEYDVLLIHDEIATGFGRSGKMFAAEHAGVSPDIMCVGKALTGGFMSLGATIASEMVAEAISSDRETSGLLMHGPTFMANPLACAVAAKSLDLLTGSPWKQRITGIESALVSGLSPCTSLPGVSDVRVLGAIGVVEMDVPVDVASMQRAFVEAGVWIRPFGNLVYLMPPYVIGAEDLERLTGAVARVIAS